MKVKSDLLYKSFFISLVAFAIIAAIVLANLYFARIAIDPEARESNILIGLVDGRDIISLTLVHCNPQKNALTFLPIPDNTMLSDGKILQSLYSIGRPNQLIQSLENITGAIVHRYIFFSVDAMGQLVDSLGNFEYLIRSPFNFNNYEYSGNVSMSGDVAKAMFTYKYYDKSKVSMSLIGEAFIQSFLSKYGNISNSSKITDLIIKSSKDYRINTNLSSEEIHKYSYFISNFSLLAKQSISIAGESKTGSSITYFVPENYKTNKNIFK